MYQIALSKSTEKVFFYSSDMNDSSDASEKNHATSPPKNMQPLNFLNIFFLISQFFWKQQFDAFYNLCEVFRAAFLQFLQCFVVHLLCKYLKLVFFCILFSVSIWALIRFSGLFGMV